MHVLEPDSYSGVCIGLERRTRSSVSFALSVEPLKYHKSTAPFKNKTYERSMKGTLPTVLLTGF